MPIFRIDSHRINTLMEAVRGSGFPLTAYRQLGNVRFDGS